MDIWRYSDWYGLGAQLRNSQKHLWHWRDWIVRSLNEDKGYDRMIMEMLAGDELDPTNPDVVAGTGFLARNYYLFNRTTWLDSTIEHTGKAFLGLTMNCAKCHDHKYDPITNIDYYRMRAIFEPHQVRLDPVAGTTDLEQDGLPRVFDDHLEIKTFLHRKGDPANPDKETVITPGVPGLFTSFESAIKPVDLPAWAFAPGTRDYSVADRIEAARQRVEQTDRELKSARTKLDELQRMTSTEVKTANRSDGSSQVVVEDSFDAPSPDVWEVVGDGWKFADGALLQTVSSREKHFVRLLKPHPRDFDLTCRYRTTGGDTYKSVTFRFDDSVDGSFNNFVYSSAHAPGPKVQVAFTRGGQTTYPPEGRKAEKIELNREYELRFAVRDTLVNVWLDGSFLLAYRLPSRKDNGLLSISGFDATLALEHFRLRSLGADEVLSEEDGKSPETLESARHAIEIAEAKRKAAQAAEQALAATVDAQQLEFGGQATDEQKQAAAKNAAIQEAIAKQAEADVERLSAGDDQKKRSTAESKYQAAAEQLKKARDGSVSYTPIHASKKALETPEHNDSTYGPTYPRQSTGRRLALAQWMVARENPLTARVAVNHVWLRHFGEPLVESVFDFGLRTDRPVHQELLDYLATELMDSGWSLRHLHRLIVNSAAYRMSSTTRDADPTTIANDPTNQYLWRMHTRRMEAQLIRDSLLHLAGELDLTAGGPSVQPGPSSKRRSLYFLHSRDQQDKFLSMFDDADLLQCYRRSESIVPQQALALANSELSLTMAGRIARRLAEETEEKPLETFIDRAFEMLLARVPSDSERDACLKFCDQLGKGDSSSTNAEEAVASGRRVRERLIHALLNHNDFISIR
ncbi:MAG: DUF1553 domain-containing protein [Pirellulaceae bacterium]